MKNSTKQHRDHRGTKSSLRGSSSIGQPTLPNTWELDRKLDRTRAAERPEERTEHFALNRDWMINELQVLASDCDRAWCYIAKPGSNVILGMTQVARAMAKHSMILGFLKEDSLPDQAASKGCRESDWWDAWKQSRSS